LGLVGPFNCIWFVFQDIDEEEEEEEEDEEPVEEDEDA
jgi:hypothetical protein